MAKHIQGQSHADYLKGDSWRCSSSPTGAHHWFIGSQTICKYCYKTKEPQAAEVGGNTVTHPTGR